MTRQMADDEVLRVLDDGRAALLEGRGTLWTARDVLAIRAAVAALQAERDKLEALREQMEGLLNTCVDVIEEGLCARQSYDYRARAEGCAEQIKELLAIKERMG